MSSCKLNTITELEELLNSVKEIRLYGAGFYLDVVLKELGQMSQSYLEKISCIMVSDTNKNRKMIHKISVVHYQAAGLKPGDYILMALGQRFTKEVCHLLEPMGAQIIQLDFNMFREKSYQEIEKRLGPFVGRFLDKRKLSGLNKPSVVEEDISKNETTAWSCWWQGEEQAPSIVKACWKSQKKYLPDGVRYVIITERNYQDYIELPEIILEKVKSGYISLTTLSDVIRAALLYRYGGFWMDSTLLLIKPLDKEILDYSLYTRNLPETQYCTEAMWAGWFFYAQPGQKLFQFLWESFYYYFSVYDRITDYFMVDYVIALACNLFPEIKRQLQAVPYNNERAQELGRHLTEIFQEEKYEAYVKDTQVQKLSYKLDLARMEGKRGTVYEWIIRQYDLE